MSDSLPAPSALIPVPQAPPPEVPAREPVRMVEISVDGRKLFVSEGATILEAARQLGIETPTLCFLENLTPVNVCRLCVVELEGSRVLVPACSRKAEPGMVIRTDSERVRLSRKMVLEFLGSSVDLSTWPAFREYCERYGATASRFEKNAAQNPQPVKIDNQLYVRDYAKCVLCYKCVQACGVEAQFTFAIGVAGRGARAHISTEFDIPLPESACVYCGNCIGVCPTGALMFRSEFEMRRSGTWNEPRQTKTDTICPYCGVGCDLTVHTQDGKIVKITSPLDHSVTSGHLCIKGRFGWQFVHVQSAPQANR